MTINPEESAQQPLAASAIDQELATSDQGLAGAQDVGGPVGRSGQRKSHAKPRSGRRLALEWAILVVIAAALAITVRLFVFQSFFIPSGSMLPTLQIGDRILVDKLSYEMHPIHIGDMVVFATPPKDTGDPNIKDLVKRVIAVAGDKIASINGQVYINGRPLAEPWLPKGVLTYSISPQTIPAGDIFVMGDNRGDSKDSRVFGPISDSLVVGRVVMIFYPLSQFHIYW